MVKEKQKKVEVEKDFCIANDCEKVIADIQKKYGKGAVQIMDGNSSDFEAIGTGSPSIDIALGGGIPCGRIIEIYGHESSGKSTIALSVVGQAQQSGKRAAYIDAEHAFDPTWAKKMCVKPEELLLSQPDSAEEGLDIANILISSGKIDIVVIDSVAALVPKAELNGEIGEFVVGLQARIMSQALRKLSGTAATNNCSLIFINQIREKIGVMFGNPETTPGGRALKFFSSVRMEVRRREILKKGDDVRGVTIKIKIVKNKVAPPYRTAEIELLYEDGLNREADIINLGVKQGIIKKCGAWFYFEDIRLGQGREQAGKRIRETPDLQQKIDALLCA